MATDNKSKTGNGSRPAWARRLEALRISKGYATQEEFARKIGATVGQYGYWERGQREPGIEYLMRIKDELGCSLDFLLAGDKEVPPDRDLGGRRVHNKVVPRKQERRSTYAANDQDT